MSCECMKYRYLMYWRGVDLQLENRMGETHLAGKGGRLQTPAAACSASSVCRCHLLSGSSCTEGDRRSTLEGGDRFKKLGL
jgi:hypothetical protein